MSNRQKITPLENLVRDLSPHRINGVNLLTWFITWILVTVFLGLMIISASAQSVKKVEQLVKDSGLHYQALDKDLWVFNFQGKFLDQIKVSVACSDKLIVYQGWVCEIKDLDFNQDLLIKLLELNNKFDKGKFVITEGILLVRIDSPVRLTDEEEFRDNIDQVAAIINESWPEISKYIKVKKETPDVKKEK